LRSTNACCARGLRAWSQRLAQEQHRTVGARHGLRLALERPDDRGGAEKRLRLVARPADLSGPVAAHEQALLDEPPHHGAQRGELDRLGEELLRSGLDRRHRDVDFAMAGEHQDRHVGGPLLEEGEDVEGVAVRQIVVEQDDLRPEVDEGGARRREIRGVLHFVTIHLEQMPQLGADHGIVVDNEDSGAFHPARSVAQPPGGAFVTFGRKNFRPLTSYPWRAVRGESCAPGFLLAGWCGS
jgi:hypothetical protein